MPDVPRSAIESAIHAENQAAAKQPEQKGPAERIQKLWGTFEKTPRRPWCHGRHAKRLATSLTPGCRHRPRRHRRQCNARPRSPSGASRTWRMPPTSISRTSSTAICPMPPRVQRRRFTTTHRSSQAINNLPASFADIMRAQADMAPPTRRAQPRNTQQGPER